MSIKIKVALSILFSVLTLTLLSLTAFAENAWDGSAASEFTAGSGTALDPYLISTAGELKLFANIVNGENLDGTQFQQNTAIHGKLLRDIILNDGSFNSAGTWSKEAEYGVPNSWTPIGNFDVAFRGGFDGNFHAIRGLYANTRDYAGLFGRAVQNVTVKNLGMENFYVKGTSYVGAIVGSFRLGSLSEPNMYIKSCYANGVVKGYSYVGGLVGKANVAFTNSYFAGSVIGESNDYIGSIVGIAEPYNSFENCFHEWDCADAPNNRVRYADGSQSVQSSGADNWFKSYFENGNVYKLLNDYQNVWKQSFDGDVYNLPNFSGKTVAYDASTQTYYNPPQAPKIVCEYMSEVTEGKAYGIGSFRISGNPTPTVSVVSDEPKFTWNANGYIDVAKGIAPGVYALQIKATSEGFDDFVLNISVSVNSVPIISISNAEELLAFAQYINNENCFARAQLTDNIVLNNYVLDSDMNLSSNTDDFVAWTPIGTYNNPFEGVFDGNGYSISGLYVCTNANYSGMFARTAENSVIKNLTLLDTAINAGGKAGATCGAFVGESNGIIDSCFAKVNVGGWGYLGGICGTSNKKLINCGAVVKIFADFNGAAGLTARASGEIENCYVYGSVGTNGISFNPIYFANSANVTNTYYLDTITANTDVQIGTAATKTEFNNGKVCYLLNGGIFDGTQKWYQAIDIVDVNTMADEVPTLFGKTVFFYDEAYTNFAQNYPVEILNMRSSEVTLCAQKKITVDCLIVFYESESKIAEVIMLEDAELNTGNETLAIPLPNNENAKIVKFFIFNSFSDIKPLSKFGRAGIAR